MTELLPCPFCGGEAELFECPSCGELNIAVIHVDGCWMLEYESEYDIPASEKEQYIAAWNARAERTCEKLPATTGNTCVVRNGCFEMEFGYWRCSECGAECFEGAKFCPNCGAKVVE